MKNIVVLGSTGSIGTKTLEIVRYHKDIRVLALAAGSNIDLLEAQAREFSPRLAVLYDMDAALELANRLKGLDIEVAYGLEGLRRGNFVQFDTGRIKHIDLLDVASSVDKLISSGVECVNDIRALLGQPLINEPWAWKHFMTKNYADIEKVLTAVVEGEQT